ncbi:MAG: cation-translocating P-type ATPase [Candidatus Roizmanbacteria bacterium]|nr:cation-translocating P-type ATPase [Candidatus Roizmanbacteria bacterium]
MQGLTSQQAEQYLAEYGQNILSEGKKKTFIEKFIEQFNNFLTLLLLGAAGLSFIIGEPVDGVLIIAIVVLNALFGIYQEAKAEESIAALKKISVAKVRVIRDGAEQEITSNMVVPGDICLIEEGVKIAADGVLLESRNIELNESVLTGESLPVNKQKGDEVFSGTIVSKGRGIIQIVHTGMQTKFGQIAHNLSTIEDTETPLQIKLKQLTRTIGIVGIASAALVFIISIMRGEAYFPTFLLAISLAVAVVPEGLPAVMTITLAIGVNEMSKKKSIVRRLSAIEALGSITLIATDKTGTLTTNKMKVKEVFVDDHIYVEEMPHMENHPFMHLIQNGILCSTASLVYKHNHGSYDVLGDPTEGALLFIAKELGLVIEDVRKKYPIIEELAFDSVTKRMSILIEGEEEKGKTIYTKGAPESILEITTSVQKGTQTYPLTSEERKKIEDQMDRWARKGLRVLAFSYKENETTLTNLTGSTFLGMVAIHDAPRPEVKEAVERAQQAGIRIIMITGDNERTAEAIGVSSGIMKEGDDIITGKQLEDYSDEELMALLPKTSIFARTTPFHKHRIVSLYQRLGEVVAVTGDGVNDAIALKQADVGIAMGLVGTDVARETADMVITDDNFASIVVAVEEGRNIIKNLKNAIQYLLSCNISEAVTLIGGMLLGFNHILFPIQLLYINLVTDGVPALSLAFSPRTTHLMAEKPQKELELLKKKEQLYILLVGIVTSVITLFSYWFYLRISTGLAQAAVFSVLTLVQSFIYVDLWLSHRHLHTHLKTLISPVFLASFLFPFITQFIIVRIPAISKVFNIASASYLQFGTFILLSACILLGIRGVKKIIHI